jgi:two-component system, OmpR family, phosphate regulon response regulator PhoB
MSNEKTILIVDDDTELIDFLALKLNKENFKIYRATDGESGFSKLQEIRPSLILLDINMPKMNGLELCKKIKINETLKHTPVIMLTAKGETIDRILGLEFGADDYITKPFNYRELILRIKNVLKRGDGTSKERKKYEWPDLTVDIENHEVMVNGEVVRLTSTEFKLLSNLMEKPGQVKSRDYLLERIWGYNEKIFSRTVDTHIQRLRTKLKTAGNHIETVRGVGYRFEEKVYP